MTDHLGTRAIMKTHLNAIFRVQNERSIAARLMSHNNISDTRVQQIIIQLDLGALVLHRLLSEHGHTGGVLASTLGQSILTGDTIGIQLLGVNAVIAVVIAAVGASITMLTALR
jgi:hypothetical protein